MSNKEELKLKSANIGHNKIWEQFNEISDFVEDNWNLLYEGAVRLGKNIEADHYAPQRIQINNTRLHYRIGLKYADGHKYNSDYNPTEDHIINTVNDINILIEEAKKEIKSSIKLIIIKKVENEQ